MLFYVCLSSVEPPSRCFDEARLVRYVQCGENTLLPYGRGIVGVVTMKAPVNVDLRVMKWRHTM